MVQQPSSSAETAKAIQTHLASLRKSRRIRQRKTNNTDHHRDLDRSDASSLDKLRRIFGALKEDGAFLLDQSNSSNFHSSKGGDNASAKWSTWLQSQFDEFTSYLMEHVGDYGKVYALRTFCGVIATHSRIVHNDSSGQEKEMISEVLLTKLIEAVVRLNSNSYCLDDSNVDADLSTEEALLTLLDSEFVGQYRDVQYYVLIVVQKLAVQLLNSTIEKQRVDGDSDEEEKGSEENKMSKQPNITSEEGRNDEVIAENMARLLLKMDYIAKSPEDLMDGATFLFAPAKVSEESAAEQDNEEESDNDGSDDSDSDSTDSEEETNQESKQNKSSTSNSNKPFTRQPKKSNLSQIQRAYRHRHFLQEAWLAVLRLTIPSRTTKLILQHLSTYILPIVPTPLRFAEYFTRSFRNGTMTSNTTSSNTNGLIAILSLHGLFQLILNHQLEYPQFYPSLYRLLHPRILYTKHRTRFLRLLSKSLMSNTMLPAYVVAAFCKKLLRLGLAGPPSGALFVLALVSNLIRKHAEVGCLIHRRGVEMEDVFVEDAESLIETRGEIS